mmetsp:Transcript_34440/g.33636  ORF Transcript_34440/g.33636 Transcript_34440/m.33636 type:complete len:150 (+) Transcript_34440:2024-2473(+)|eukprot:CAMPEP_0170549474 /NCGR_PEP_ID=MMETSP0211-20121228/7628_1 /TAXON_ID=311385 /ORGANISM="Pseudokeronopsis sp., Strain OXSARD2" /LENGTH=149 /DNA_ID=CAMNT_0010855517 /DNA_START=1966 /DNA_END=2415 /DNA_ORIENTATION=+
MIGTEEKLIDLLKRNIKYYTQIINAKFYKAMLEQSNPSVAQIIERIVVGNKKLIESKIAEIKEGKYKPFLNEGLDNPPYVLSDGDAEHYLEPNREYLAADEIILQKAIKQENEPIELAQRIVATDFRIRQDEIQDTERNMLSDEEGEVD